MALPDEVVILALTVSEADWLEQTMAGVRMLGLADEVVETVTMAEAIGGKLAPRPGEKRVRPGEGVNNE